MKFHPKYCTYIPLLVKALAEVPGDVLEMGTGIVSTHVLHWMCLEQGRQLVSYENNPYYYKIAKLCEADFHQVLFVEDWDNIKIEYEWAIALVDHAPAGRRRVDIRRLADCARVVLIHDSQGRSKHHYHYNEILPLFRFRCVWWKARPYTTALSNFVDVGKWNEQ